MFVYILEKLDYVNFYRVWFYYFYPFIPKMREKNQLGIAGFKPGPLSQKASVPSIATVRLLGRPTSSSFLLKMPLNIG